MRRSALALTAVIALLLSGCAAESAPPTASTALPSPSSSPTPEKDIFAEALKVLGPVPAGIPLTAEQEETARLAEVERSWASLLERYPEALRPAAEFEHYVTVPGRWRTLLTCVNEQGIYRVDHIKNVKGEDVGFDLRPPAGDEMRQYVAQWGCDVRFPQRPFAPLTANQIGYLYDYQTQFVVPCIEAHGAHATTPPPKDVFVAKWPNQEWWPSAVGNEVGIDYDAIDDACPGSVPGLW